MDGSSAVYEDEFVVPRSAISEDITLASFDKGCSLTKALIGYRENDTVRLKCLTFNNTDFDDAMAWMRSQITFGADQVVNVTGIGGDILQGNIAKALDCKTKWVDEMGCQCKGIDFLLKHASDADIFYPEPKRQYTFNADNLGETWTEMKEHMLAEHGNQSKSDTFPTIFAFLGSAMGICLISEDSGRLVNGGLVCGKTLSALSNQLLGTSDFQKLDNLAMKGDRAKVDILAKEMLAETSSPLYLALPSELSILPLAKLSDDHAREVATSEDKASGLLTMFVEILAPLIFSETIKYQASQIVLGGNLVRSQYFREAYASGEALRESKLENLKVKYLKTGHTGAIGAMLFDI